MFDKRPLLSCLGRVVGVALILCGTLAQGDTPLRGNDNPVLAWNPSTAQDWNPGMQFLDVMKSARPWIGHIDGQWGGMTFADLKDGEYLDRAGWVTQIPEGLRSVGTVFNWTPDIGMKSYRRGRYIVRFEGEGRLQFRGDATVVWSQAGEVVFQNRNGETWMMDIVQSDPDGTGDYVRNITVVPELYQDLYDVGATFNPDWLALVEDSREFRFMDWGTTNNSRLQEWSDRPLPDAPYQGVGHAVEDMVQLANEVGADVWFTMPHLASPDYLRRYAQYVQANLDPRLQVRVEWSNEVWNGGYHQTRWVRNRADDEWGEQSSEGYLVKMAAQTARIWRDVFDAPDSARLETVLGGQTVNLWHSTKMMAAQAWRDNEPSEWKPPAELFDVLAVTAYFGHNIGDDPLVRQELLSPTSMSDGDINTWLADRLRVPDNASSLPSVLEMLRAQSEIAHENGMKLVLYEGGQHVHSFLQPRAVGTDVENTAKELAQLHEVLGQFVNSPQMADLYRDLWIGWSEIGDGPFMQYTDMGRSGRFGSWGLRQDLLDNPPRAAFLDDISRDTAPWWPSDGGPQYQQGVTVLGNHDSNEMHGTPEEDYLIGRDDDDLFFMSAGSDGIHGGAGRDVAQFSGLFRDYHFEVDGPGLRVSFPDGSSLLRSIEILRFADGSERKITDFISP